MVYAVLGGELLGSGEAEAKLYVTYVPRLYCSSDFATACKKRKIVWSSMKILQEERSRQ